MKKYTVLFLTTLICFFTCPVKVLALPNPFQGLPFLVSDRLPSKTTGHQIAVISTRFFKPADNYALSRGLQPRYQMFTFVAAMDNDTAFVKPVSGIAEAMINMPRDVDFLVYVDGHGKTFDQLLQRGFEISERFGINVVLFDWPTDYLALRKTARNADEVTGSFVMAIQELDRVRNQYFRSASFSVIFHSMGNHILKNIIDDKLDKYMPVDLFSNIILNAAAVRESNHVHWLEKINFQQRIYITLNDEDRPLRGAQLLRLAKQLGSGISGNPASNAFYIDFSEIASIEHNLFLGKSEIEKNNGQIYRFYNEAFHGKQVELTNETGFRNMNSELVYTATPMLQHAVYLSK